MEPTAATRTEVTVKLSLTPEEERMLVARAAEKGQDVTNYLRALVAEDLKQSPTLSQILAPIHEDFRKSGMTDQELDALLEGELAEVSALPRAHVLWPDRQTASRGFPAHRGRAADIRRGAHNTASAGGSCPPN